MEAQLSSQQREDIWKSLKISRSSLQDLRVSTKSVCFPGLCTIWFLSSEIISFVLKTLLPAVKDLSLCFLHNILNPGHPKALFPVRCLDSALAVSADGLDALVLCF